MRLLWEFIVLYFIFAVGGWVLEVSLKYIQYHRFINRGFLIGPYCPIYGWGAVIVSFVVGGFIGYEGTYVETFFAGCLICGALEYFTSFYMEKMFKARWWDYSDKPMNLNGRIWIGNIILFGLASVVIVKFVDPLYFSFIRNIDTNTLMYLAIAMVLVMNIDGAISHFLMNIIKKAINNSDKDDTEEIANQVHEMLHDKGALERRILEAYPDFKVIPEKLKQDYVIAKQEYKKAKKELRKHLNRRFLKDFNEELLNDAKDNLAKKYAELYKISSHFKQHF